jgi:aspartate racemase
MEAHMKTIGMIGGMSWESSIEYYRLVNEYTHEKLGGLHNARSLMYTVDFDEIEALQRSNRWSAADEILADAAVRLEKGGADFIVICTNTMHKSVPRIQQVVQIPILHIADATARQVEAAGIQRIGLLGTRYTMEEDFYKGRLTNLFGLDVLVPEKDERELIHRVIFEELVLGTILPESRQSYLRIIDGLVARGAQGVILGCTEIGLLVKPQDTAVSLFDTTRLHARAAVEMALED